MNINQSQKDNLYKGLGLFLEAFRQFVVSVVMRKSGADWEKTFFDSLQDFHKESWKRDLMNGTAPENILDYQHFQNFAYVFKDLLKADFGRKAHNVKNWLGEIYETRNKVAHFDKTLDDDEAARTWIHLKTIANLLGMTELEAEIVKLRDGKTAAEIKSESNEISNSSNPQSAIRNPQSALPWFRVVTPHLDIRQGNLDESVYAANLAEVALGAGREIYANPILFFEKTFFTSGLKAIARTVVKGLNGVEDAENRVMSLQTGFGGGKTHTLISLFHLCKWGKQATASESVKELLSYTGAPDFERANIAVFTNTTNDPANGRIASDGTHIQTIWGELAFQLGGKTAFEIVRKNDEQMIAPAGLFKKVLETATPALILIDELADYCVKASARVAGNSTLSDQTISFMQELTQAVSESNKCVLLVTLPMSVNEISANPALATQILSSLETRVRRVGADTKPVADEEIYEVIRRRLFENIGDAAQIEAAVSKYFQMFQENWMEMPAHSGNGEYRQRMLKSYPFHPELIDVFRVRWASSHEFQRTRGVLRLLAAIVSDLWKRQDSIAGKNLLIDAGNVNFTNLDALSGQLKRLYGNGYDAVISADVSGSSSNAFKIDSNRKEYGQFRLAESIASVILMNSFGTNGANRGVSIKDIKLNLLEPEGFNHNSINGALDELEAAAYYLYYAQSGADKRYWFHTKPNLNILVNQAKSDVQSADVVHEILRRLEEKSRRVEPFHVLINPTGDVPEQTRLTLVILHPEYRADVGGVGGKTNKYVERISTKKGSGERIYRNTMLFLAASEHGYISLEIAVKEFLACEKISKDYASQLERDQKEDLRKKIEDAGKAVEIALVNAYTTVLKHTVKNGCATLIVKEFQDALDRQINENLIKTLKTEEWLLDSVGLGTLRNNNLLPTIERAVKVKDVYEAFLRFDDKPLITNQDAVQKSLQKYCYEGAFAIAAGDGKEFTKFYLQENVPFLDATDANYWLVDKSLKPAPPVPMLNPNPENGEQGKFGGTVIEPTADGDGGIVISPTPELKQAFKSIVVSGKVPIERFHELFQCFAAPFTLSGNKVEITVNFNIAATEHSPLDESKPLYKNAKEAAKQLNLKLDEEV